MFIQDKYGFDKKSSSYMAGAVYDVSMLISPFLGIFIVSHADTLLTIPREVVGSMLGRVKPKI